MLAACCAGGPGSIPAIGICKKSLYSDGFFSRLAYGGRIKMEPDMRILRDLASPCSKKNIIIILAAPSVRRTWYKCEVW